MERLECPIIIGDLPDMSAAVGLMLGASQMPDSAILTQLNERIAAWAAERSHVTVFPLAKLVRAMANRESFTIGSHEWSAERSGATIQADQLHPTVLGLVALNQQLIQTLGTVHGISMERIFENEAEAMRKRLESSLIDEARRRRNAPSPANLAP